MGIGSRKVTKMIGAIIFGMFITTILALLGYCFFAGWEIFNQGQSDLKFPLFDDEYYEEGGDEIGDI